MPCTKSKSTGMKQCSLHFLDPEAHAVKRTLQHLVRIEVYNAETNKYFTDATFQVTSVFPSPPHIDMAHIRRGKSTAAELLATWCAALLWCSGVTAQFDQVNIDLPKDNLEKTDSCLRATCSVRIVKTTGRL